MMIYTNHLHMKSEKGKKKWEKKRERGREMKSIYTYECTAFHGFRFITAPREHSKSSYFSKSYSSHLSCRTHSRLFVPSIDPVLSKPFMCMSIVEAFLFFFWGGEELTIRHRSSLQPQPQPPPISINVYINGSVP